MARAKSPDSEPWFLWSYLPRDFARDAGLKTADRLSTIPRLPAIHCISSFMDFHLRQLQRAARANPSDVECLQRYISALERLVSFGSETPSSSLPPRSGWKCPDDDPWVPLEELPAEHLADLMRRPNGGRSPDGICAYFSEPAEDGRQAVELIIDGQRVLWKLPEDYTGDDESDDWCIFCGEPEERK